eukprot:PhM_4_TR19051/c0_g1_i1/m.3011
MFFLSFFFHYYRFFLLPNLCCWHGVTRQRERVPHRGNGIIRRDRVIRGGTTGDRGGHLRAQVVERLLVVHTTDNLRQERRRRQDLHLGALRLRLVLQDRVRHNHLCQRGAIGDARARGVRQDAVRGEGVHLLGPVLHQRRRGLAQGPGGVNHVVDNVTRVALHIADRLHRVHLAGLDATLQDGDNVAGVEKVGDGGRALDTAGVGGDNDGLLRVEVPLVHNVLHDLVVHREVVDGEVLEEALDLTAVQVHRQHTVDTHGLDELCHGAGADGHAGLHFAVLAAVGVVRHHGGDALRARQSCGVDHQKELHEGRVDLNVAVGTCALDNENVVAADVLVDLHIDLSVGEVTDAARRDVHLQAQGDAGGEAWVGVACDESHLVACLNGLLLTLCEVVRFAHGLNRTRRYARDGRCRCRDRRRASCWR